MKGSHSKTIAQGFRFIAKENAATSLYLLSMTVATLTFGTLVSPENSKAESNTETAGDIIQVLIPATAFSATFFQDDEKGRMQFYKSFFTNLGTTYALKYAVNKPRPENHGDYSFPSGHTSAAFQGATFIHLRYGWEYSIPAYLGASFVGWSRVEGESDKHDAIDVLAGAAVGIFIAYFFTDPYEKLTLVPIVDNGVYGIGITGRW